MNILRRIGLNCIGVSPSVLNMVERDLLCSADGSPLSRGLFADPSTNKRMEVYYEHKN